MGTSTFQNVRIAGLAAAVPNKVRTVNDDARTFGQAEVEKLASRTGVIQRHVSEHLTTADLCCVAAERLLSENNVERAEICALIFVTQTSDYQLPATACLLQDTLGLASTCAAFDVNLGCSGYVYGLWLASSLIESGAACKVLLLVGDTISRVCSPEDRATFPIFGDAGTATLLASDPAATVSKYVVGTDGRGRDALVVPAGGARQQYSPAAMIMKDAEGGNRRADINLYMDGAEVFAFTLKAVPALMSELLGDRSDGVDNVDHIVFHQANKFMLDHLYKRLKLPPEKCIVALERYGNTSSASIPLALVTALGDKLRTEQLTLLLAGFGVGWSWAGSILNVGPMPVCELILVDDEKKGSV